MDIIGKRRVYLAISAILVILGLIVLGVVGLNLGVDFTGGSLVRLRFDRAVSAQEVRSALTTGDLAEMDLSKAVIQPIRGTSDVQIRAQVGGKPLSVEQVSKVVDVLSQRFGSVSVVESQMVEAVIGKELLNKALVAIILSCVGIVAYISFRFEFKFGVAAVLALIHDTIVVLGIFAILGRQVNSPFIAAVLTIIGYSINDTIVIYDKIRENLRLRKKDTVPEIANISILQTMRRSIYTVLTTLLAVAALYLFGGVSIRDFSLAIIIGLVAGTYSSIFVAPSIWVEWTLRDRKRLKPV
ncbi:MAG: protein translocase subunit SecF [Bacillota bacterium]|nr:protein translocase subunit SecF [Bacillota bacterium]MDI9415717.1 protein translocase subunit SecF [Bacillota bacterium]NLD12297.1 protein translocase subunit SecF [Bacillota bacterium]HCD41502.1 protein translocase subunit SecF [Bacillota bacterium]HOB88369.1 protein translocase subunit SecF [Bacillota bacterium]